MNSVALMILLLRESLPLDEAVFADTGGEVPETYEYLEVAREYLAVRNVHLTVVAKSGDSLYDTAWRRRVFPSAIWRWSTRDFKVTPIHPAFVGLPCLIRSLQQSEQNREPSLLKFKLVI